MTYYGPDISSYQAGLDLSTLNQATFVIAKASEGTYYTDAEYPGWRQQAASLHLAFAWYHFLTTEDAAAQVHHTMACIGDHALPGMLDIEVHPQTGSRPTMDDVLAYVDIARSAGLNLTLAYLPEWYWKEIGSPNLTPLAQRGLQLVASSYPGGSGPPAALYPGDGNPGWNGYGGMIAALWQYTNQASDGGQLLDYNAFRGTRAELAAVFAGQPAAPTTGGLLMALSDADQAKVLNDVANVYGGMFFGGSSMGAVPPGGQNNSLVAKLDYLIAQAGHDAGPIDAAALTAAIDAHLTATASPTADTIAGAVVAHLAATLAKG